MIYFATFRIALFFGLIAFVLWLISRRAQRASGLLKLHQEGRNRLLDRFSDAESFLAFIRTEEGRSFLQAPQFAQKTQPVPGLRLLQISTVALPLGIGMLILSRQTLARIDSVRGNHLDVIARSDAHQYELFGVVMLCAGVGLLLAALAAWLSYRMSRSR